VRSHPDASQPLSSISAISTSLWAASSDHCPGSPSPSRGPRWHTAPPQPIGRLQRPTVCVAIAGSPLPPLPLRADCHRAAPAIPRPNRRLPEDRVRTNFLPGSLASSLHLSCGLPPASPFSRRAPPWGSHTSETLPALTLKMGAPHPRGPPRPAAPHCTPPIAGIGRRRPWPCNPLPLFESIQMVLNF
jgi:hypothetical protein